MFRPHPGQVLSDKVAIRGSGDASLVERLNDFLYAVGTNAACTDLESLDGLTDFHFCFVEIRHPSPAGYVVGVADIVSGNRAFAANIASLSHSISLQEKFARIHRSHSQ